MNYNDCILNDFLYYMYQHDRSNPINNILHFDMDSALSILKLFSIFSDSMTYYT